MHSSPCMAMRALRTISYGCGVLFICPRPRESPQHNKREMLHTFLLYNHIWSNVTKTRNNTEMNRSTLFALTLVWSCALSLSSCVKAPFLTINGSSSYNFTREGGTQNITFSCNRDWGVNSSCPWLNITPLSGTASDGDITLTVTISSNTTYDSRTATFFIEAEDLKEAITITQETGIGLMVSPAALDISSEEQTIEFKVQQNVQYSITIEEAGKEWIKHSDTKALTTDKVAFKVSANTSYDSREGKITFKQIDGDLIEVVTVRQESFLVAVDLGLSVKWANVNIGAFSPEEYGNYYAYGEIEVKDEYTWENYKWCNGSNTSITKYNDDPYYGVVDNKNVLDLEDDVAHVVLGKGWRIPTKEQIEELIDNCTWTSVRHYHFDIFDGIGYIAQSKINGNSIYLPMGGFWDRELVAPIWIGFYSSSTTSQYGAICNLSFNSSLAVPAVLGLAMERRYGYTIRPVTK